MDISKLFGGNRVEAYPISSNRHKNCVIFCRIWKSAGFASTYHEKTSTVVSIDNRKIKIL